MVNLQLTKKDVFRVARRTVEALYAVGYTRCCLFGSAACCRIWGNASSRVPGDLDIVVFTNDDPEIIKEALEYTHYRFYRVDGRDGPYKVLWYLIRQSPELKIKVDILTPGKKKPLGIPRIPSRDIWFYDNLPVMPILPLLILKVQGWRDHRRSRKYWHRWKEPQDVEDIEMLLSMVDDNDALRNYGWLHSVKCKWFMRKAIELIETYVDKFPNSSYAWGSIGFDVYY